MRMATYEKLLRAHKNVYISLWSQRTGYLRPCNVSWTTAQSDHSKAIWNKSRWLFLKAVEWISNLNVKFVICCNPPKNAIWKKAEHFYFFCYQILCTCPKILNILGGTHVIWHLTNYNKRQACYSGWQIVTTASIKNTSHTKLTVYIYLKKRRCWVTDPQRVNRS